MYAFANTVYLVVGVALALFGAAYIADTHVLVGFAVVVLGVAMATFASYQMGQASARRPA